MRKATGDTRLHFGGGWRQFCEAFWLAHDSVSRHVDVPLVQVDAVLGTEEVTLLRQETKTMRILDGCALWTQHQQEKEGKGTPATGSAER